MKPKPIYVSSGVDEIAQIRVRQAILVNETRLIRNIITHIGSECWHESTGWRKYSGWNCLRKRTHKPSPRNIKVKFHSVLRKQDQPFSSRTCDPYEARFS